MKELFSFLIIALYSLNVWAIEYYHKGQLVEVYIQKNEYVIEFNDIKLSDKRAFLENNSLPYSDDHIGSKYIRIKAPLTQSQIDAFKLNEIVNSITNLYVNDCDFGVFTITNEILIMLKDDIYEQQILNLASKFEPSIKKRRSMGKSTFILGIIPQKDQDVFDIANEIYESGFVVYSTPNFVTFDWIETNDYWYTSQWNLTKIAASSAWSITTGSSSINIAILDCGIESDHDDLDGHIVTGYDVVDDDNTTEPGSSYNHGTAVAGIASAETNNSEGIAGVGYNCSIIPVQISHTTEFTISADVAEGFRWASDNDADIINFSGYTTTNSAVTNAIDSAATCGRDGKGCVIVKSAGNDYGSISFPGENSNLICVGATDNNDVRRNYSNYGSALDVMAPTDVYSTDLEGDAGDSPEDYYYSFGGTSFAAPHVSGLAGLILANNSSWTASEVREIICKTAHDIGSSGFDNYTGWGRINAYEAVIASNAPTISGTLSDDEIWVGTVTLTNDVIIPTTKTLEIKHGTVVNIPSGKKIQVNGTLIADNVTFQPTSGATWWGINFYNCSSSSAITNSIVTGSTYGITMYYYSNVLLQNNEIELNDIGLFFSYYSDGYGIVNRNDIESNEYGVYCINYCDPTLYETAFIDNDYAIYGSNSNCNFNLGSNSSEGQNAFLWNGYYDIYSTYTGTIQAQYNYWDSPADTTNNYGNTNCSNLLTTGPWYLYKKIPGSNDYEQKILSKSFNTDTLGMAEIDRATQLFREGNYDQAFLLFNDIIDKYSDHFAAKRALVYLFKYQKKQKISETTIVLENFVAEYKDQNLEPLANHLLACELLQQGNYKDAISKLKAMLASKEVNEFKATALCDIGTIYYYHLGDQIQGKKYLRQLMVEFPDSYLTDFAASTLGEWIPEVKKKSELNEGSVPIEYALLQNYPNPFNPVTNIEFSLPKEGRVVFEIYNVLGQKIATLLDVNQQAGQHIVKWNGTNDAGNKVSAGIYLVRMRAGDFEKSVKVMLLP